MPSGWPVRSKLLGLVHGAGALIATPPRVSEQVKVAPASAVNDHAGLRPLPGVTGAAVMAGATGGVVSRR